MFKSHKVNFLHFWLIRNNIIMPYDLKYMHAYFCFPLQDSEDHAVLLCSLLLGFGLDAYVCVGTKNRGAAHAWVLTLGNEGTATFWESLTGHR